MAWWKSDWRITLTGLDVLPRPSPRSQRKRKRARPALSFSPFRAFWFLPEAHGELQRSALAKDRQAHVPARLYPRNEAGQLPRAIYPDPVDREDHVVGKNAAFFGRFARPTGAHQHSLDGRQPQGLRPFEAQIRYPDSQPAPHDLFAAEQTRDHHLDDIDGNRESHVAPV